MIEGLNYMITCHQIIFSNFNKIIFSNFNINIFKSVSLPSLAFRIYKTIFMPTVDIPNPKVYMEENGSKILKKKYYLEKMILHLLL